ncbi:MAG: HK97-gp10 family putative phage morphogenesis protein [Mycobacterium sp.]
MSGEFKVEGFEELFKTMDELAEEIGQGKTAKIWRTALGYAMEPVLQAAKQRAPVDSGQLRDHIYMKAHKPQGRDKSSNSYKGEMFLARVSVSPKREDSAERTVLNKRGKFQTISYHRPVALGQEFGNAHTSPHPFIRSSLESNLQNVIDRLGYAIWAEVNWGKYAKKG